jgi:hypothetical protein
VAPGGVLGEIRGCISVAACAAARVRLAFPPTSTNHDAMIKKCGRRCASALSRPYFFLLADQCHSHPSLRLPLYKIVDTARQPQGLRPACNPISHGLTQGASQASERQREVMARVWLPLSEGSTVSHCWYGARVAAAST